jgi:hypothetical protein
VFSYIARTSEHRDELFRFRNRLHEAILHSLNVYRQEHSTETIYAFALVGGQCGNYLGYQLMTEQRLDSVAEYYYEQGYRHKYTSDNAEEQLQKIRTSMRWQNPEDDWHMDDFADSFEIRQSFEELVYRKNAFGEDARHLVEFCCDDVLASLHQFDEWRRNSELHSIILGVQSDEADFFTCCVRCNPFHLATKLWHERFTGNELDRSIKPQD